MVHLSSPSAPTSDTLMNERVGLFLWITQLLAPLISTSDRRQWVRQWPVSHYEYLIQASTVTRQAKHWVEPLSDMVSEVPPRTGHEGPEGEQRYSYTLSLTSALDGGVGGQRHAPAALNPGKRPGTHCIGGWVDPRAGLDGCGKSRPRTGIRSPDRSARSESLYRLSYPGRFGHGKKEKKIVKKGIDIRSRNP